jgi:glycosyltransferase involved in cell wall biosynthesis
MNIVMLTNTYTPHVGGVARSVEAFAAEYRGRGHRVLVVAPEFENQPHGELGVVRIPAIQNFNGSDFSVVLPVSGLLTEALDAFEPDIVHSHHPYLLGMTALRIARYRELPLVFTHHTLYEQYTHYVPADSPALKRFAIELATRYANLSDQVFAPSESIALLLSERGVQAPIAVVPTGVNVERFAQGDGLRFRAAMGIPADAFVVGHVGRLAPEKNLGFLAQAVAGFLGTDGRAHFLVAGKGPSEVPLREIFSGAGLATRLHLVGTLQRQELADCYHAMDLFVFASKSETQGMVLTEAMAAGVPVVALDAPGARETIEDRRNGRLLQEESAEAFMGALQWMAGLSPADVEQLKQRARQTADRFSMPVCASKALSLYEALRGRSFAARPEMDEQLAGVMRLLKVEWDILEGVMRAAGAALRMPEVQDGRP